MQDPKNEDKRHVTELAKETLAFMAKNQIAVTPKNFEDWFFVLCKAKEEEHLLTDQNLFILYEDYLKDKPQILNDFEAKQVSQELKDVASDSEDIVSLMDNNIEKHKRYIQDSKEMIKTKDEDKLNELYSKIDALEQENSLLKEKIAKNIQKLDSLQNKFHEFKKLGYEDPLTGLANRRGFEEDLQTLMAAGGPLYLVYLDIDNFKSINDTYGHSVGDEVLKDVGEILNNFIRKDTRAYRLGGEEFAILIPNVSEENSYKIAERIRKVIENHNIRLKDGDKEEKIISYTASFGITGYKEGESMDEFVDRADKAMYQAKKAGKNRVVIL